MTASAALSALDRGGQTFLGVKNADARGFELLSEGDMLQDSNPDPTPNRHSIPRPHPAPVVVSGGMRLIEGRGLFLPQGIIKGLTNGIATSHSKTKIFNFRNIAAN